MIECQSMLELNELLSYMYQMGRELFSNTLRMVSWDGFSSFGKAGVIFLTSRNQFQNTMAYWLASAVAEATGIMMLMMATRVQSVWTSECCG